MEKRKHKFNIFDVIVILLAAAAAFGIWKIATGGGEVREVTLSFVMQSAPVPEDVADNVAAGDGVYDKESGALIGRVVTCDSRQALYTGTSKSGASATSDYPGFRTLYITCTAEARADSGSFVSGGVTVSAGRKYTLMLPHLYCEAECISVESEELSDGK